jgi:hypothetical protein
MVRIKGPASQAMHTAVSRAQKKPELLHPGLPNTYDRNSFFKKACSLFHFVRYIKPSKVRDKEG